MKELLAQEVRLEGFRQKHWNSTSESPKALSKMEMESKNEKVSKPTTETTSPITPRKLEALALAVPAPKRLKVRKTRGKRKKIMIRCVMYLSPNQTVLFL